MKINDIHTEPLIEVGILSAQEIRFSLPCDYPSLPKGRYSASVENGKIKIADRLYEEFCLVPYQKKDCFQLEEVRIGIHFHWERRQVQSFEGNLKFIIQDNGLLTAVNQIPLERYLYSVIASEMSANASLELLKAHTVISRSWLLAQLRGKNDAATSSTNTLIDNDTEHIRWYEREAHTQFDVCADDHCQRYQGVAHAHTPQVIEALNATRGMVLSHQGDICDARFYKCCGGMTELFENCWDNSPKSYLTAKRDYIFSSDQEQDHWQLQEESQARAFIMGQPVSFCHTKDTKILSQVLNDYDLETADFYRWNIRYSTKQLSDILRERSGMDFGEIQDLEAVERGPSGRIVRLRVVGSKRTLIIGKELEIRKFLSTSHLYSSAFVVDKEYDEHGKVSAFVLHGAGWGHGVGLCQIGAAVMSAQGYSYDLILQHYYPGSTLHTLY